MAKKIETRISNKHDFEINWIQAKGFVPLDGELIIYDKETDENGNILTTKKGQDIVPVVPLSEENGGRTTPIQFFRIKIGDGRNTVNNLPFFGEQYNDINKIPNNIKDGEGNGALEQLHDSETWTGIDADGNQVDYNTEASGKFSAIYGGKSYAEGSRSLAGGTKSVAKGSGSLAFGDTNYAGDYATAFGYQTRALGAYSHTEGRQTVTEESNAHAEGSYTKAKGNSSHAEGSETVAEGLGSHAEGSSTKANGGNSHAEGKSTIADGFGSHAEGEFSIANGLRSHAEGQVAYANGNNSHAEGSHTEANGDNSHAEGSLTHSNGENSHAEGNNTIADGNASHAEGTNTKASQDEAHAEGWETEASGHHSHSEGQQTKAIGDNSHAGGRGTIAAGEAQTAIGRYNKENSDALFIVGNGDDDENRKNAFVINADGSIGGEAEKFLVGKTTENGGEIFNDYENNQALKFSSASGHNTSAGIGVFRFRNMMKNTDKISVSIDQFKLPDNIDKNDTIIELKNAIWAYIEIGSTTISGASGYLDLNTNMPGTTVYTLLVDTAELPSTLLNDPIWQSIPEGIVLTNDMLPGLDSNYVYFPSADFRVISEEDITDNNVADAAHAEGSHTFAAATGSHAEGADTTAAAYASHAEGSQTRANAPYAHAEGVGTKAMVAGHSEGGWTAATGDYAHAQNLMTEATGVASHAGGWKTKATTFAQTAIGKANAENAAAIFIVGNGTSEEDRKNAFTVNLDGTATVQKTGTGNNNVVSYGQMNEVLGETLEQLGGVIAKDFVTQEDFDYAMEFLEEEIQNQVGQSLDSVGAEIFNDYHNNQAFGKYSTASGFKTVAGATAKGFSILNIETENIGMFSPTTDFYFELSTAEGIEFGDSITIYSQILGETIEIIEKINSVSMNTISVTLNNGYEVATGDYTGEKSLNYDKLIQLANKINGSTDEYLIIPNKPELVGDRGSGTAAHAEGYQTWAISEGSHAEGVSTIAGSKAFTITSFNKENKTFTCGNVSNFDGLSIGDFYSIYYPISSVQHMNMDFIGTIIEISDNTVTVDNFPTDILEYTEDGTYYIWFPEKPGINGDMIIGTGALSTGYETKAIQACAASFGYNTIAAGKYSIAEGKSTKAGFASHSGGEATEALGKWSLSFGRENKSLGDYSTTFGIKNNATEYASLAIGEQTNANGKRSATLGYLTTATGENSLSGGKQTQSIGINSLAFGDRSIAKGDNSISLGVATEANGAVSFALGYYAKATGPRSFAVGDTTQATAYRSFAEGFKTQATGLQSHASGSETLAYANDSYAGGLGTIAGAAAQMSIGKYNKQDSNALFIIGNGTKESRNNAFTVNTDGTATIQTIGTNDNNVVSYKQLKDYVAENKGSAWDAQSEQLFSTGPVRISNGKHGGDIYIITENHYEYEGEDRISSVDMLTIGAGSISYEESLSLRYISTTWENLLSTPDKIRDLQNKADSLDNVLRDILEAIKSNMSATETVSAIEQTIVSYLENKTISEVEE